MKTVASVAVCRTMILTFAVTAGSWGCTSSSDSKPSGSLTVSGVEISVISAERAPGIVEGNSNIRAGEGQEFLKVVLALSADNAKEPIEEFNKWRISFVEADGEESEPAFGWRFSDKEKSTAWIYSYPKDLNTEFKGLMIEGTLLPLSVKRK